MLYNLIEFESLRKKRISFLIMNWLIFLIEVKTLTSKILQNKKLNLQARFLLLRDFCIQVHSNYLKPISIEFSSLIIGLQAFFMRNVHIWLMIARQELRPWFVNRFVNTRDFNYDLFMVVFKGKNRDNNRDVIFGL